jgi:hypothetical protein
VPILFVQKFWAGLSVWILLFISDYTLTLVCVRRYQKGVRDKIVFEGSYELTPYFQRDIDSLRVVSPRFIAALALNSTLLFIAWRLVPPAVSELYVFLLGAMILTQLAIHIRHLRNLFIFRAAATDAVRGRIEYSRPVSLRGSSVEMLAFSGMFLVLFVFTQSWFILGGCVACLGLAAKHWRLARKPVSAVPVGAEKPASASMS